MADILSAVGRNDIKTLNSLISSHILSSSDLDQALHLASEKDLCEVAKGLIKAGADVNANNNTGKRTCLHDASQSGRLDMVNLLVDAGADPNTLNRDKFSPLTLASRGGYLEVVQRLMEAGAAVDVTDVYRWTPVFYAAHNGFSEITSLLAGAGANINAKDKDGCTPAHAAAENGHAEVIKVLVEAGADVNIKDNKDRTALHEAVTRGHVEAARQLTNAGADAQAEDSDEKTAMHHLLTTFNVSVAPSSICKMFTLLIDAGATVDGATATISPLVPSDVIRAIVPEDTHFWLAANNDAPMLAAELAGGLDPNMKTENGMTLLHWACAGDAPECVQLLLDAGADKETVLYNPKPMELPSELDDRSSDEDGSDDYDQYYEYDGSEQGAVSQVVSWPTILYAIHSTSHCMKVLIDFGFSVNDVASSSMPINYALAANSPACITALVGGGAWVTQEEMRKDIHCTPMLAALTVRPVPVDALRALLAAAGERVLSEEIYAQRPLMFAISHSTVDGVRVLVEGGADPTKRCPYWHKHVQYEGNALEYAERYLSDMYSQSQRATLTAIVDYLKSLPCFSKEQ